MPFTMTVPTTLNGARGEAEVTGQVYILRIGDRNERFLCHPPINGYHPRHERDLTHIKSGYRIGRLDPVSLGFFISTGKRPTDRSKAEKLIEELVRKHGADTVLRKIDEAVEREKAASASQQ